MKKVVLIIAMCLPIVTWACLEQGTRTKEQVQEIKEQKWTFVVMDTAGTLIPNAYLTFSDGTPKDSTSWDGRCVIEPRTNNVTVKVTAEGYLDGARFTVHGSRCTVHGARCAVHDARCTAGDERLFVLVLKADPAAMREHNRPLHRGLMGKKVMMLTSRETVAEKAVMMDDAMTYATSAPVMAYGASVSNGVAAGKLTAGEVNDFAKWYMWDSVLFGSHKQFIDHWKICASERYTVQVVNAVGAPVANRLVSLTDKKGNTLFQARTDNTGKAELWGNLLCDARCTMDDERRIECGEVSVEVSDPTSSTKGREIVTIRLDEECEQVSDADIFFIVDATGSMGDEIRYLQAEMKDVIRRSQDAVPGLKIRTGALMYRDHGDEYLTRISRLTDDIQTTQDFIDRQEANGGGDYEEAIPEALMSALNVADWNDDARTRIAFLILDAPCHRDSVTLALLHEQILNAAALGVRVVPIVCSGLQPNGELLMRQIALATNGTSFFLTDDSGIGETHLRPNTDSLVVEHLNDMLVRTIIEFASMPECTDAAVIQTEVIAPFLPTPSLTTDDPAAPALQANEVLTVVPNPCSAECHYRLLRDVEELYFVDLSGKTLERFGAQTVGEYTFSISSLSSGVYFLSAYCQGRWVSAAVLIK